MPPATILVADDDPVTIRILSVALHHEGYRVISAMDAIQAVMFAHRHTPAAIILDVMMPGGSGLDVLGKLKRSTETQLIPVIAISGSKDPELPAKVEELGAEAFFPKPLELAQLTARLRQVLEDAAGS